MVSTYHATGVRKNVLNRYRLEIIPLLILLYNPDNIIISPLSVLSLQLQPTKYI